MNKEIPEKLEQAIKSNNLILFIGAGCSLSFGLPNWKNLILHILEKLDETHGDLDSLTHFRNIKSNVINDKMSLFEALNEIELRKPTRDQYKSEARQIIYELIDKINLTEKSEKHSLFWKISTKIITTNYDRIIEKFIPQNLNVKVFDNRNDFQSGNSLRDDSQFLYHIHGDYQNPNTIILFESDYQDIYNDNNHNYKTLETFFKGKTILFIGFSLSDPFVTDLFENIKKIYGGYKLNNHFAFTTNNDDFTQYDIQTIQIENWDDSLKNYLLKLSLIKKETSTIIAKNDEMDEVQGIEDLNILKNLIKKKSEELRKNPSDSKLLTEINDIRAKIDKQLFGEIDYFQKVDINYKKTEVHSLFENIYSLEKYDRNIIDRINRIRNDHTEYNWYDRSVILSGLTCNLIHFNKADEIKINLIIDFINDNEEKVWQKAITSLFIVLNHLGNKWIRFPQITKKLELLKQIPQIQEACFDIIQLFNFGYHQISFLNEDIFKNPYFKESPFNYFLPFFIDDRNEGFVPLYENFDGDIDKFKEFLEKIHLPDQIKYLICNSKGYISKEKSKVLKSQEKEINTALYLSSYYYPYSTFIHEIINFYRFFPNHQHQEKLNYQVKITENKIITYLLSEVEKHKALASHFMKEKQWSQAIINIVKADSLAPNNTEILLNLADCYKGKNDSKNEKIIRLKIKDLDSRNIENLNELYSIYFYEQDDKNSLNCLNELIELDSENWSYFNNRAILNRKLNNIKEALGDINIALSMEESNSILYCNRALIYFDLHEYERAFEDSNTAVKLDAKKAEAYDVRGVAHFHLKRYNEAIKDHDQAINLNKYNSEYFMSRAQTYKGMRNYKKALEDNNKAIELNSNNPEPYYQRASTYLKMRLFKESMDDLDKAIKIKSKANFYLGMALNYIYLNKLEKVLLCIKEAENLEHNNADVLCMYANYYRLLNDLDKAISYIEESINIEGNAEQIGTKAEIYSTKGDDEKFFFYFEQALIKGVDVDQLFDDVIDKYKNNPVFLKLLEKYNQNLNYKQN